MVGSSPSFGIFNSLFLFWMLDHITNKNVAATAYNHSNDPGFQKWRQEVETLAKDNEELRGKLSEMDRQIKSLEGTPKDPSYLPPGVPVEAALAPTIFGATHSGDKPLLRLATGQPGGWYNKFAALFEKQLEGLEVRVIPTSGSLDNMKLLSSGAADMALVQSDVLALRDSAPGSAPVVTEQATLFKEYVQLLANRSSGIKSLTDLDPKRHEVYVGPKDSGTAMTWSMLCKVNPSLARIKTKHADYQDALSRVQTSPGSLMLFVGGLNSDFLKQAEAAAAKKDRLRLIPIDDSRFTDISDRHGNKIYEMTTIRADVYPHLQKGWFFGHDVKTLAVQAVLVLRNDWAARFGTEAMDGLSAAIVEIRPTVERIVNGAG
jgi:TRAP transporter TAXI family solute receptor